MLSISLPASAFADSPALLPACLGGDVAPYRLSGTVYGTLLNDPAALAVLGDAVHQAPYKAPPVAPVLYIKPRNTLARHQDSVFVPAGVEALEVGATLGVVLGRTACRVSVAQALEYVAGYTIVNDIRVPHAAYYRPSIRFIARDGFCPLGPQLVARAAVADPDALQVRVWVDGVLQHRSSTAGRVRGVAQLLADVTAFMTLQPGDVLMLGAAANPPLVRVGQTVRSEIEGLGALENRFVAEGGAA